MEILAGGGAEKAKPNKPNRRPLAGIPKHEARNPKQVGLKEQCFKKQSQFSGG